MNSLPENLCTVRLRPYLVEFFLEGVILQKKKFCRRNQNTQFIFDNFLFPENHFVYAIMWKNMIEPNRPQMTM